MKTLQKRLISKTEQVVNCDLLLQEKEKLYVELQDILAKQPGPRVAAQVSSYQTALKDLTGTMKSVAAELNMNHAQISDYQYEIERVQQELAETKRRYYDQKRRNQLFTLQLYGTGSFAQRSVRRRTAIPWSRLFRYSAPYWNQPSAPCSCWSRP